LREGEKKARGSNRPQASEATTCAERIRLGEQSLNVNQRVAVEMSEILSELLLTQNLKRFATYFDLESGTSRSLFATPEKIEQAVSLAADKNRDASEQRKCKSKRK
jgi:hypothetical protein